MAPALIGVVVPGRNSVAERDIHTAMPEGVRVVADRCDTAAPKAWRTPEDIAAMIAANKAGEAAAIARLAAAQPDCIVIAETAPFRTRADEEADVAAYRRVIDIPMVFWLTAYLDAFAALGGIRRIGLLSPMEADPQAPPVIDAWRESGVEIAAIRGAACTSAKQIAALPESFLRAHLSEMSKGVDALVVMCTNIDAMRFGDQWEREFQKPVLTINGVLAWAALRRLGLDHCRPGLGRIFATH